MKNKTQDTKRVLARKLAKELTAQELEAISGGVYTYSGVSRPLDPGDALH
ncbi:MAG: class IIb bacteriocin, lactobin A/cerein 7B family [Myxococcota bacterium]